MTSDDSQSDEESTYALVMPFVVCASHGGPLEDHPFVIGYELGGLGAELSMCETLGSQPYPRYVHEEGVAQLDLIAMRHGYVLSLGELDDSEEWRYVDFIRYRETENDD
jgi:hypothetical protein